MNKEIKFIMLLITAIGFLYLFVTYGDSMPFFSGVFGQIVAILLFISTLIFGIKLIV